MPNKLEFRETIDLGPAILYKQDLFELENLLLDTYTHKNDKIKITLTYKEKRWQVNSFKELFEHNNLPEKTDKLTIEKTGWIEENGENIINRGITLTLYHNYINCYIHSYDEDWYKGKISRVREFFENRKPWYAVLSRISPLFPTIAVLILFYSIKLIKNKELLLSIAPLSLFTFLSIISVLSFQQKIFPHVKIVLKDKTKFSFGWNELQILFVILTGIITILQFIFNVFNNK